MVAPLAVRVKFGKLVLSRLSRFLAGETHLGVHSEYTPFQVLVSTIISQRTRDEQTAKASARLFSKYPDAKLLSRASQKAVAALIRDCGFYNQKAGRIVEVSKEIASRFGGKVPDDKASLMSLPGVGSKTANCVLVYGFSSAAIPVDTHVHRISNRLGLAKTKTPEQTEMVLEKVFDKKDWLVVNEQFVRFGQTVCRPIGPRCKECPLNDKCPTGQMNLEKWRKSNSR